MSQELEAGSCVEERVGVVLLLTEELLQHLQKRNNNHIQLYHLSERKVNKTDILQFMAITTFVNLSGLSLKKAVDVLIKLDCVNPLA